VGLVYLMKKMNRLCRSLGTGVSLWLSLICCLADSALAQPASINGAYDPALGTAIVVQTTATGFGLTQSELDASYAIVAGGKLYLFLSGNLQNNSNNINLFIADGRSGQSVLFAVNPGNLGPNSLSVMNGSKFSQGFSATYAININNGGTTLTVSQYDLVNNTSADSLGRLTTSGGIVANATVDNGVVIGFNNNNTSSQAANVGAGSRGLELAIPLSLLSNPSGSIKILVDINGSSQGFLSNQFLPGLPAGTANLGGGGTGYGPGGGVFDLSSTSNQFFVDSTPAVLTINGINADYGMTHVFVNEGSNDAVPLTILFSPNVTNNIAEADVYSDLNRRDYATLIGSNGIEEGIVPPDGNSLATGDTNHYYEAYSMSATATPGQYSLTLYAQKTGVYRLTARFMVAGATNWSWYGTNSPYISGNRRDFMVVVSPKKALGGVVYELAVNNIDAAGAASDGSQRSTFSDLTSATSRFNLNYVTNLGVNWLWLEPIHPIGTIDSINSPYCVKNFFQVSPLMSKLNTRPAAMTEFTNFVAAADAAGVNVMMDEPFDHTAHDVELDAEGVADFGGAGNPGNWQPTDLIPNRVPQFFSLTNSWCSRASSPDNIAIAPDICISKWTDVNDIFFGDYAALVCANPADNNNEYSADDWFDYSNGTGNFDGITQNVWRYFADSILYWLNQTGCTNGTPASQTSVGIDGMRADFADGLPPQCWEYIINKVRSQKWDFVFLAESLSWPPPSATTYRSARDFDITYDSVYSAFQSAYAATNYQSIFDSERSSYGSSLMMWNAASHDAGFYYTDPYQALIRFMVGGTIDGLPHVLYGQELGTTESFGFSVYSGDVPSLYTYNSLQPAIAGASGNLSVDQLYPLYAAVGKARQSSPALQSANRIFLAPTSPQPNVYAVAKFVATNGAPNFNDVVFAFVNLDTANSHQATFSLNLLQNGANNFGIQSNRIYNVKNLAAYSAADPNRVNDWLWNGSSGGVAGSNLLATGISVTLNSVPTSAAGWTNTPFEPQYLKLYDVTPPPTPVPPTPAGSYVLGINGVFSWLAVVDAVGGVSGYFVIVGTSPGASDVFSGFVSGTSITVSASYGAHLYAEVAAVNDAGIQGPFSGSSLGMALVDPNWIPIVSMPNIGLLSWNSVSGKTYQVRSTTNLALQFSALGGALTATSSTLMFPYNPTNGAQYFKIELFP
jgi:glycosidase